MRHLFRYRLVGFETSDPDREIWHAQRRFLLWPFWSHIAWHSSTGHDFAPTTFPSEERAFRALPAGVSYRTFIRPLK